MSVDMGFFVHEFVVRVVVVMPAVGNLIFRMSTVIFSSPSTNHHFFNLPFWFVPGTKQPCRMGDNYQ